MNCTLIVHYIWIVEREYNDEFVSGVPPGKCLGSTLFLLYINYVADIFNGLTVSLSLIADDVKIYTRYTLNDAHGDLQIAIYRLIEWTNKWQLQNIYP